MDTLNLEAINNEHALNPEIGDYWYDHFCPVYYVVDVGRFHIAVLHKTKDVDSNHWTWDIDDIKLMTRHEFNEKVRYRGLEHGASKSPVSDKCWCFCSPRSMNK